MEVKSQLGLEECTEFGQAAGRVGRRCRRGEGVSRAKEWVEQAGVRVWVWLAVCRAAKSGHKQLNRSAKRASAPTPHMALKAQMSI